MFNQFGKSVNLIAAQIAMIFVCSEFDFSRITAKTKLTGVLTSLLQEKGKKGSQKKAK